ncbi:MAG: hypothetical protein H9W81_16505 [Enterococcus sp.]|nr:hypothetical protein [Enterococcus sp.]
MSNGPWHFKAEVVDEVLYDLPELLDLPEGASYTNFSQAMYDVDTFGGLSPIIVVGEKGIDVVNEIGDVIVNYQPFRLKFYRIETNVDFDYINDMDFVYTRNLKKRLKKLGIALKNLTDNQQDSIARVLSVAHFAGLDKHRSEFLFNTYEGNSQSIYSMVLGCVKMDNMTLKNAIRGTALKLNLPFS